MKPLKFLLDIFFYVFILIAIIFALGNGDWFKDWAMQDGTVSASDAVIGLQVIYYLIILYYVWVLVALFVFVKINLVTYLMTVKASEKRLELFVEPENIEVAPKSDLNLIEIKDDSLFQNATQAREKVVGIAKNKFLISINANFIIGLTYLIYSILIYILSVQPKTFSLVIIAGPMLLIFWNAMSFLKFKYQIQAYGTSGYNSVKKISGLQLFLRIFGLGGCNFIITIIFLLLLMSSFSLGNSLLTIVMSILLVILSVVFTKRKFKDQKRQNLKLLILRVFGNEKISKFTFTTLVNYWKHFGTYFTVVDPTFYKIYLKRKYNSTIIVRTLLIFLIYVVLEKWVQSAILHRSAIVPANVIQHHLLTKITVSFLVLLLLSAGSILVIDFFRIRKIFLSSTKNFKEHIEKQLKRPIAMMSNAFKSVPVMCFDNTWKRSIYSLSYVADIVLMDLRGYSETNKGCEYEVDFLFDNFPCNRIVFVTNQDSVIKIREMIFRQWAMLRETSPNLSIVEPSAQLYITNKETVQNVPVQVQGILDSLFFAVESDNMIIK